MNENEILNMCTLLFLHWKEKENNNIPLCTDNEDLEDFFIPEVIRKKFNVFKIDINVPDDLLIIISLCTQMNPAYSQIVVKKILTTIKDKRYPNGIPKGYTVTSDDFVQAYPFKWPIVVNEKIGKELLKEWDAQKKPREESEEFASDNKCDTPEWWLEVMED